jgi:hypothetical protein
VSFAIAVAQSSTETGKDACHDMLEFAILFSVRRRDARATP